MITVGGMGSSTAFLNAKRPAAIICHICGRQYGTASIAIHVKSCTKKFEEEESKKPKNLRRPVPTTTVSYETLSNLSPAQLEQHNEMAFKNYNDTVLQRCENCGRTFLPDRLTIHQRSCTSNNPARRVGDKGVGNGGAPTTYSATTTINNNSSNNTSNLSYDDRPLPTMVDSPQRFSNEYSASSSASSVASNTMGGTRPPTSSGPTTPAKGSLPRSNSNPRGSTNNRANNHASDSENIEIAVPPLASRGSGGTVNPSTAAVRRRSGVNVATASSSSTNSTVSTATPSRPSSRGATQFSHGPANPSSNTNDRASAAWRASISSRLGSLATRLAYIQETLLSEVQDIQQEISDLTDEVAMGDTGNHQTYFGIQGDDNDEVNYVVESKEH